MLCNLLIKLLLNQPFVFYSLLTCLPSPVSSPCHTSLWQNSHAQLLFETLVVLFRSFRLGYLRYNASAWRCSSFAWIRANRNCEHFPRHVVDVCGSQLRTIRSCRRDAAAISQFLLCLYFRLVSTLFFASLPGLCSAPSAVAHYNTLPSLAALLCRKRPNSNDLAFVCTGCFSFLACQYHLAALDLRGLTRGPSAAGAHALSSLPGRVSSGCGGTGIIAAALQKFLLLVILNDSCSILHDQPKALPPEILQGFETACTDLG